MRLYRFIALLALFFGACTTAAHKKEWRVAIDPGWYPLDLKGRDKQLQGFAVELLQEVALLQKLKISVIRVNWDNLISNLQQKQYEGMLSSLPAHLFYEKQYDFSDPFLLLGPVLVLPVGSKAQSLKELSGKEIAVISGSDADLSVEKYPEIIIRYYDTAPDALNAILAENVDGAVIDVLEASAYCRDLYQGKLRVVGEPFTNEGLRLVTLHDQAPELIKAFNSTLKNLKKSGKYAELARKWNLQE